MLLCVTTLNIYWLALRSCPHLPGCLWKRIDFFSVLAFRAEAHWNSIFVHQKGRFSKTVPGGIFVKKRRLIVFVWKEENGGFFKNDDVIRHIAHALWGILSYHRLSVSVWTGENDLYTLCVGAFFFFLKTGRIAPFSKYPATSGRGFN